MFKLTIIFLIFLIFLIFQNILLERSNAFEINGPNSLFYVAARDNSVFNKYFEQFFAFLRKI